MDINDPRRRLQVLSNSSPSIRVATAPQQRMTVNVATPNHINVGGVRVQDTSSANNRFIPAQKPLKDPRSNFSKLVDAVNPHDSGRSFSNPGRQTAPNFAQRNLAPTGLFNIGKEVVQGIARTPVEIGQTISQNVRNVQSNEAGKGDAPVKVWNPSGWQQRLFGKKVSPYQEQAAEISDSIKNAKSIGPVDNPLQGKEVSKRGATAALFGLSLLPGAAKSLKDAGNARKATKAANDIAKNSDPEAIKASLGVDDEVAHFLASETNPDVIKSVLQESGLKPGKTLNAETNKDTEFDNTLTAALDEAQVPHEIRTSTIFDENTNVPRSATAGIPDKVSEGKISSLIKQAEGTPRPKNTTRVFQAKGPTGDTDYVFDNVDSLDAFMSGKTTPETIFEFRDVDPSTLKPGKAPGVFQVAEPEPVTQAAQIEKAVEEVPVQSGISEATPTGEAKGATEAVAPTSEAGSLGNTVNETADSAVDEILSKLDEASTSYNKDAKIYSKKRGSALYRGEAAAQKTGGLEGYKQNLGALKGNKKQSGFQPLELSPEGLDSLLTRVQNNPELKPGQKLNTQTAILKVTGHAQGAPTPADIRYIRESLGDNVADAVEQNVAMAGKSKGEIAAAIASTPKAAMATADLSAPLRQGGVLGTRFPKQFAENAAESVKYFGSPKAYQEAMVGITKRESYQLMKKAGLHVDGAQGITGTEEAFMSSLLDTDLSKKLLVGHVTDASNRGYTGFLTKFRADVFDKIIADTSKAGVELSESELKSLGKFINSASGRGNLGSLEKHAGLLSKALFSPRLWKSRLDLLNPIYYAKLEGPARKYAIQSSAAFASTAGTVLALAAAAGAAVEWDPRSADFAKIKIGNTRYDILGGLQQNIRLGAQLITGEKINSETGELATLGPDRGFGKPSRKDLLVQFFENKENPLLAYATKILEGTDAGGEPINLATEGAKLLIPLNAQSIYETAKDTGKPGQAVAMNVPGTFGVGVQTYGKTATKDQGKPASNLKDQIAKDAKDSKTTVDDFKKSLSKDDQSILAASASERKALLDSGKITEDQYNQAKAYDKVLDNIKGNPTPKGVVSEPATAFFKKYDSMTEEGRKAWLKGSPDATAKTIAEQVNKQRSKGLSEFKPSNELSKAYSEYEKDINSHPDYTEVDKRNKAKAFQSFAYRLNYTTNQRDIYNEGGSGDLRTLMDNKQIDKADLNEAIKIDNELYNSGLTGQLKFSKKFRTEFGYGLPSKAASEGSGGSGRGGSEDTTKRAYLADLLPSAKESGPKQAPQFSSRNRIKFSPPAKIGGGNGKKVSIKL